MNEYSEEKKREAAASRRALHVWRCMWSMWRIVITLRRWM